MSDQATATATEAPATPAAEPAQPATPAAEPAQPALEAPAKPGFMSRHEARQGLRTDAQRAVERANKAVAGTQGEAAAAPSAPAEPTEPQLEEDEAEEAAAAQADQQPDPNTGQHPQWREGDPEQTYRDPEGRLRHASGPLKGKFAAAEEGGGEGEEAAAEGRASDAKPEAQAAGPRPIPVEIPEGHAVREMGLAAINVADERSAEAVRALANGTYVRRQENEALRTEVTTLRRQLIEQEARGAAQQRWRSTPEYAAAVEKYNEIKEDHGAQTANEWWQGKAAELKAIETEEFDKRWSAVEQESNDQAAEAWANEARTRVSQRVPAEVRVLPDFGRWLDEEIQLLNLRIERGQLPNVKNAEDLHREFVLAMGTRLVREPQAAAVLRKQRDEKAQKATTETQAKAAAAAVDNFKKGAAEKRVASPPHPLGAMGHAAATGRVATPDDPEAVDVSQMSSHQLRRHLKAGARQDARRHLTR